jgi:hypothetical protein
MSRLPQDVRSAFRLFAFYLGNGTLALEVLEGFDYRPALMEFGSDLERVFAIFANVLDVDTAGQVTNYAHAERRAAQWIRGYCDEHYQVDPPFEDWEFELP